MDKTAIQTKPSAAVTPMPVVEQLIISHPASPIYRALRDLASLRLTVVLFVLSMFLVFFGTLAQTDSGIWTVVNQYFRSAYVWVPLQLVVRFFQIFDPFLGFFGFDGFVKNLTLSRSFLFPGGWLIGSLLLANLLAAHAVRFRFTWNRAGILILHAGIIVMMLGELITGLAAVEARMTIAEGEAINFTDVSQRCELTLTDSSARETDDVCVIPGKTLRQGGLIQHSLLPVDVEVLEFMDNSTLIEAKDNGEPFVRGTDGLRYQVSSRSEESGVETNAREDAPAARIKLRRKGSDEILGTYLVSLWFYPNMSMRQLRFEPQIVTVDGKSYTVDLRFKREYKPYTLRLLDFKHELYPGTNTPKDFSSYVRLTDPSQNEDRELRIWMNHPLRYAGETFYQSGVLPGDKGTVLQVVRNPGWLLPYFSCCLVALGMIVHFGIKLNEFLRTSSRRNAEAPVQSRGLVRYAPWAVAVGVAGLLLMKGTLLRDHGDDMRVNEFSRLPVINDGRVKPWDTLARTCLMKISGRQSFTDEKDRSQPAIKWLLDVVSQRPEALKYKVFYIENEDVLGLLDLKPRSGFRYAVEEFSSKMDKVEREATRAQKVEEKTRALYDVKILELASKVQLYIELAQLRIPHDIPPDDEGAEWTTYAKIEGEAQALAWARLQQVAREKNIDLDKLKAEQLRAVLHELARRLQGDMSPAAGALSDIFAAYVKGQPAEFNKALSDYEGYLRYVPTADIQRARFEVFVNDFDPFYICMILYCLIFVLSCVSFALAGVSFDSLSRPLNWTAFGLALITLAVHTGGLLARMYLMDRPLVFVTNLYSSAIFIGWGCVVLGLIIEIIFRVGVGNLIGSVLGFSTALIAHHLATSDTLEMMQAVLDTNFWLATHVTCVTLGYTATFVAGFLGILFVLLGVATPVLNRDLLKVLSQMIYGVVCFATLMSFVGTVLGGIWADQSWGRFWGWDPKENGALLIVIWNALILHARWSGLIRPRGMAVLTIVGNMVTGWSWFGTNQLSVGLHAYGFNKQLAYGLTIFWLSQLAVIALGTLPTKYWWSYNTPRGLAPQT